MCTDCLGTHLTVTCDLPTGMQLFPTGALNLGKIIKKHINEFVF